MTNKVRSFFFLLLVLISHSVLAQPKNSNGALSIGETVMVENNDATALYKKNREWFNHFFLEGTNVTQVFGNNSELRRSGLFSFDIDYKYPKTGIRYRNANVRFLVSTKFKDNSYQYKIDNFRLFLVADNNESIELGAVYAEATLPEVWDRLDTKKGNDKLQAFYSDIKAQLQARVKSVVKSLRESMSATQNW